MTDGPQHDARRSPFVIGTTGSIGVAVMVVWCARSYGRTVGFAFGINWILIAWAIWLGRVLESRSGAWDGLSCRLPASYYAMHPFEKGGRIYDYLGVRWYRRLLRRVLWSVNPALLRSQPEARETMTRATQGPEAGHLIIFVVILGITLWPLVSGWWNTVAWLLLFNLLHNAYPVLSLRQVRARLDRRRARTTEQVQ
jgi:hypothetical protein